MRDVTLQGGLTAPVRVGTVAVALARVVGVDLSVVELAVCESSDSVQSLAIPIEASRQCFLCLGKVLADAMPWGLEYLVKQHTPMMCTAARCGQRGDIPASHD